MLVRCECSWVSVLVCSLTMALYQQVPAQTLIRPLQGMQLLCQNPVVGYHTYPLDLAAMLAPLQSPGNHTEVGVCMIAHWQPKPYEAGVDGTIHQHDVWPLQTNKAHLWYV